MCFRAEVTADARRGTAASASSVVSVVSQTVSSDFYRFSYLILKVSFVF